MKFAGYINCALSASCISSLTVSTSSSSSVPASTTTSTSHCKVPSNLTVDLGYSKYRGHSDPVTNINRWLGIRYAAPPVGPLRYQAPQAPLKNNTVIDAGLFSSFSQCPQTGTVPVSSDYEGIDLGAEDCLFLSIFSPECAHDLPVFVWIHGGGFQNGNGKLDFSNMMQQSNNSFVTVVLQYRLNSFGFLSSPDVKQHGQLNAGLLDQKQALQWVQDYIYLFGGDRKHVTLGGESAGAASIYFHSVAEHGFLQDSLWTGSILSSAAVAKPYRYDAVQVNQPYFRLADGVNCLMNQTIFQCLVDAPFDSLLNASNQIAGSELFAIPPFEPVVDGDYLIESPGYAFSKHKVNGRFALVGNQANEGFDFTPHTINAQFPLKINTSANLAAFIRYSFPLLDSGDIEKVIALYPESLVLAFTNFDELFESVPEEVAVNLIAEPVFYCPSMWFAQALERSYRYQFSIPPALHATDLSIYLPANETQAVGGPGQNVTASFRRAFLSTWINFIVNWNPSSPVLSPGVSSDGSWPLYNNYQTPMVNFNITGGESNLSYQLAPTIRIPQVIGGENDFGVIDERSWQGGRGERCDFWRGLGGFVPI